MTRLTESIIENFAIELFQRLGYEYIKIKTIKKIAAYHQYYAVNKTVESTIRATGFNDDTNADRKAGVVWHTQGSGKSLSMV